jgi:carbonic anhydrase
MDIIYRFDPYAPLDLKRPKNNKEALKTLHQGNCRFYSMVHHLQSVQDGKKVESMVVPISPVQLGIPVVGGLAQMHSPYAAVLGCADARVPIEHIFDCSSNDLFVVRVAGNVLGLECIGSIDYAATALRESLQSVIVLGHTNCGAVGAAVNVYLAPSSFAEVAFSHPVRTIIDRIMVSVRSAAEALEAVYGSKITKNKQYKDWLINASCFVNSAFTAYDLQREVNAVTKGLVVSYSVYDMAWSTVNATPIRNAQEAYDTHAFGTAPKNPEDLQAIAKEIAQCMELPTKR